MARVLALDICHTIGRYATIRKVCVEGALAIQAFWKFAPKLSNQSWARPNLVKLEHQNESIVVTIPHASVIRYVAI
jgi:hypothetical protein